MLVQVLCHTAKALPIRQLVTCSSQHQCGKMQKSVQNTRAEPVQALRSCRYAVCRSYSCGTQSSPPSRQCSTSCKCAPPINKSISPGGRTLLHTRPASHLAMLPVLRAVPVRHSDLSMLIDVSDFHLSARRLVAGSTHPSAGAHRVTLANGSDAAALAHCRAGAAALQTAARSHSGGTMGAPDRAH